MKATLRVLLADDDAAMRSWVARVLTSSFAVDVHEVADGIALVEALAHAGPFDLVITDVRMPGLDGERAMLAARRAGVDVAFVIVSAFADAELRSQVEAVPGARLLEKPFSTDALLDAVMRPLGLGGSAGRSAIGNQP